MFVTALVLAGLPGLSAGAAARNKPWDLNVYTHCSEVDLERDDFTGIAYNPKDDLIWAVAPGSNETAIWGFDSAGVVRRSLFSSEQVQLKGDRPRKLLSLAFSSSSF